MNNTKVDNYRKSNGEILEHALLATTYNYQKSFFVPEVIFEDEIKKLINEIINGDFEEYNERDKAILSSINKLFQNGSLFNIRKKIDITMECLVDFNLIIDNVPLSSIDKNALNEQNFIYYFIYLLNGIYRKAAHRYFKIRLKGLTFSKDYSIIPINIVLGLSTDHYKNIISLYYSSAFIIGYNDPKVINYLKLINKLNKDLNTVSSETYKFLLEYCE